MDALQRLAIDAWSGAEYNRRHQQRYGVDLRPRTLTAEAPLVLGLLDTVGAADSLANAVAAAGCACDGPPGTGHRHDPAADARCRLHDALARYRWTRETTHLM